MSKVCAVPENPLIYPRVLPNLGSPERARGPLVRISQGLFDLLIIVAANPGLDTRGLFQVWAEAYPGRGTYEGVRKQLARLWSLGLAWETRSHGERVGRRAPPKRWYTLPLAYGANFEHVGAGRPVGSKNKVNWGARALKQRLAEAAHPKVEATAPKRLADLLADDQG